jgi:hypothetical protein
MITFSQALEGYFLHADARRLSPHTIADYANTFRKFQQFLDCVLPLRKSLPTRCAGLLPPRITSAKRRF